MSESHGSVLWQLHLSISLATQPSYNVVFYLFVVKLFQNISFH